MMIILFKGLKESTRHHSDHIWLNIVQTEITMEICVRGLIRAMSSILLMKVGYNLIKVHIMSDANFSWQKMIFLKPVSMVYTVPHAWVGLTDCFPSVI